MSDYGTKASISIKLSTRTAPVTAPLAGIPVKNGRLGLFGGTFDPIHNAHLAIATAACRSAGLDAVMVMPSGMPALKRVNEVSMPVYRYEMARLACTHHPHLALSDIEIRRTGPSYTLDTVIELGRSCNNPRDVFLIGGTDILFDLPNWHEPSALMRNCTLLIGTRPGHDRAETFKQIRFLEDNYYASVRLFRMPSLDISSTAIRKTLAADPTATAPLPEPVSRFIHQYHVYEDHALLRHLKPETVHDIVYFQQCLWDRISSYRLIHSVSTAMTAIRLALRFGFDADAAAVAGVLHDASKEQPSTAYMKRHPEARDWLSGHPAVIHGPAGAEYARERFGITDPDILNAITYHTTLRKNASPLEKIIFLSDKIEAGRGFMDLKPIREAAMTDLNDAVLKCLVAVRGSLRKKSGTPHPFSVEAIEELENAPPILAKRKDNELADT